MASKTYIRLKKPAFSTKYIGDAFVAENRRAFQEWGNEIVRGYNSIVSNWSTESKPKFVPRIRYQQDTKRFYVYIDIKGTELQIKRFEGIDFGAPRDKKVTKKQKGSPTFLQLPRNLKTKKDFVKGGEYDTDAYDEYYAEIVKQNTFKNPQFTRRGMPMRVYDPKTKAPLLYGGPGKYYPSERYTPGGGDYLGWDLIPIIGEYTQKPIKAREWSRALYFLVNEKGGPGGQIWDPQKAIWRLAVRRGYARGVTAANRVARNGAG